MTHEEAVLLIADLAAERLPAEQRAAALEHVRGCEECGPLRDTYRMFMALRDEDAAPSAGHPGSAALVAWALGQPPGSIPRAAPPGTAEQRGGAEDGAGSVAAHVAACPTCRAEAEATRGAAARSAGRIERFRGAWMVAAIAAGLAALLLYPGFLGWSRLSRLGAETEALRTSRDALAAEVTATRRLVDDLEARLAAAPAWSGVARVQLLAGPRRGAPAAPQIVTVPRDAPGVLLALEPPDPGAAPGALRAAITGADGAVTWSIAIDASDLHRVLRESGRLTLVVPASALPQVRGTLTIAPAEHIDRPLLRILLAIHREH